MSDRNAPVSGIQVTSRYGDGPLPDPATMCKGQCEGMGCVPISKDDPEEPFATLWKDAEAAEPADDGWHFVKCPECDGTGLTAEGVRKREAARAAAKVGES